MSKIEKTVKISIASCFLHNRAAHFVKEANAFQSKISLTHGDYAMNAKSLLGMLMLRVAEGDTVVLTAEGADAASAVEELAKML